LLSADCGNQFDRAVVDVVEEPAPGVITVTEFEETEIREPGTGEEPPEES
jgi:hypothetical protein